ncbi:MAG: hypothetical protein KDJ65_04780 [Anaerolineae bacterium]|nr:hypothetical protein [Anaerolineae bacterium]
MAKINAELQQQIKSLSSKTFDLIVRTDGDATPYLDWCREEEIEIKQQFRLSPGLAVTCSGEAALKLLDQAWVKSVELDQSITTM